MSSFMKTSGESVLTMFLIAWPSWCASNAQAKCKIHNTCLRFRLACDPHLALEKRAMGQNYDGLHKALGSVAFAHLVNSID